MADSRTKPPGGQAVFAIFAGGGAKGMAHLGAASAAEELGIEFLGVAGASAGAFVAALLAGGYRGAQLFDPDNPRNDVLSRIGETPLSLLGEAAWSEALLVCKHGKAALGRILAMGKSMAYATGGRDIRKVLSIIGKGIDARGHLTTGNVREVVNRLLSEQVRLAHAREGRPVAHVPTRISFKDLDYRAFRHFRPLKIIATDISECRGTVFSLDTTPDVEVGEAVAASIAIPVAFQTRDDGVLPRPRPLRRRRVGFQPADLAVLGRKSWPSNGWNPTGRRSPPLAFTLVRNPGTTAGGSTPPDGGTFARQVVYAAVFGGQQIPQRFVDDLVVIPLGTDLATMSFDASVTEARTAVAGKAALMHSSRSGGASRSHPARSMLNSNAFGSNSPTSSTGPEMPRTGQGWGKSGWRS